MAITFLTCVMQPKLSFHRFFPFRDCIFWSCLNYLRGIWSSCIIVDDFMPFSSFKCYVSWNGFSSFVYGNKDVVLFVSGYLFYCFFGICNFVSPFICILLWCRYLYEHALENRPFIRFETNKSIDHCVRA